MISKLEIVNGVDLQVEVAGNAPTVQIDLSRNVSLRFSSQSSGLTDMRVVHASCSDVYISLFDKDLQLKVPTSLLQDQMATRVSVSGQRFRLKTLGTEGMKKGGYLNLSLLDSSDGIPIPSRVH